MAQESGQKEQRISIPYFEGVNSTIQHVIAKKTEMAHMENARAPIIGVLEKRQGQAVLGTDENGDQLVTLGNFGLFYFPNDAVSPSNQGLFRVSTLDGITCSLFVLNGDDEWVDISGNIFSTAICDFANAEGNMIVVNGTDLNYLVSNDLGTMATSAEVGSIFNSPPANKATYYKSRIYLADYTVGGVRYKTNVLRSSYSMGVISLVNGDLPDAVANIDYGPGTFWEIPVTENKYFYTDAGMNQYEIYRGSQKVANITITTFTETSIVAADADVTFEGSFHGFLSSDEIWIAGTFDGEKQYRWINNASSVGRDVKQYDTFKLGGGDETSITMLEPIGNILLVANNRTMMTWNDYNLENFDIGVGCCSKNGYVKLKGAIYFLDYSGVYSTSGGTPQLLSRKVERYIRGATKEGLEEAAAGYKGLSVFFTIGNVTLYNNDGSLWKVLPQTCLEFNVADQNWYVHTNVAATQFETFIADDGTEKLSACSLTVAAPASLGPELITNGNFTGNADGWTLESGWSYGDNNVIYRGNG